MEFGHSALMRRDRLERIAMAERDRRAGRVEVAVAALGEATEWPARVVLALANLADDEAHETRRILEAGLDAWAEEVGLDSLDCTEAVDEMLEASGFDSFEAPAPASMAITGESASVSAPESDLDRPIDNNELELAFAEAEAQTDEMHDVNQVAEQVLMGESIGLASLTGDDLVPTRDADEIGEQRDPDVLGMDAAEVPESISTSSSMASSPESSDLMGGGSPLDASEFGDQQAGSRESHDRILATLGRWLENLEERRVRRAE